MTIKQYIDLGWHTVPLSGELKRNEDGSKTVPVFEPGWKEKYAKTVNNKATALGGVITGPQSGIMAIDCDNEATWNLFRKLDAANDFVFLSKGKGYDAGTLIYEYDDELATSFSVNDGDMALDFYADNGFVYLPTTANKTKVSLGANLPDIRPVPTTTKVLLKQLLKKTVTQAIKETNVNVMTANCIYPTVKEFINKPVSTFMPGLFKILTPRDFRSEPEYIEKGYLHPNNVPQGRGSEYLSKVSAILGADISIDHDTYIDVMSRINGLFDEPLPASRLDKTITDPMLERKASIDGVPIWKYDSDWDKHRLILSSKRQSNIELAFDDKRNMYYVVDEANQKIKAFNRDSEMMAYVEATAIKSPKKIEVKQSLPIINVESNPALEFGFNNGEDPTARTLNTFIQTPELIIFNNPDMYASAYKEPTTILKYFDSLVPEIQMRDYLLKFVKTKLKTFSYSPVVLYFMGVHGSGKDLFVGLLETILGNVARPTTKEFLEMFNGWVLDTYFVQLDEYGNQLTGVREREEALGKIKAYTGKQNIQIRQMRTDGFNYKHNFTIIMTANKNPLMLEDGDRRIAFFQTPNKMTELDWVIEAGGIAEVYNKIQAEIKDFCYYLATEVGMLTQSEYVTPPQSGNKDELIADSMYAAQRIAYALKRNMFDYLVDLCEVYMLDDIGSKIKRKDVTTLDLEELYEELTDGNGNKRNFLKVLRSNGIDMKATKQDGVSCMRILFKED